MALSSNSDKGVNSNESITKDLESVDDNDSKNLKLSDELMCENSSLCSAIVTEESMITNLSVKEEEKESMITNLSVKEEEEESMITNLSVKEEEEEERMIANKSVQEEEEVPKKSKNQMKKEIRRGKWKEIRKLQKLAKEQGITYEDSDLSSPFRREKRKAEDDFSDNQDIKKAKLETKALKAKRPGFSEERYNETSYYIENKTINEHELFTGLRKVYPYYFTFTTFTKGRWVGEKIIDVFAKEFRAHPAEEYERCIKSGTLTVNYEKVDTDYRLKHNDLLANIVHRHETPVLSRNIEIIHLDEDLVVLDKPCSLPVHPCGRYRHNTVVFILAKEYNLKNLRTIHRLDRLTSGLLLFGRTPKKAREMEQQIRTRQVTKEYVCRVEGEFPPESIECNEPIEVVSYKIGVCKVAPTGKDCRTEFKLHAFNGKTSVVICRPYTGRMHQIRVHLQYLGYPIVNDPLYNHTVFGPTKGKGGIVGKTDEQLIQDLIKIHNAENWLGMDGDAEYSMFKGRRKDDNEEEAGSQRSTPSPRDKISPRIVSPPTITSTGQIVPSPESGSPGSPATLEDPNNEQTGKALNGATPEEIIKAAQIQQENPRDYTFRPQLMTYDPHCYECKVKYRDPKPKDLVMFLHALKYAGPGWHYETKLPYWADENWKEDDAV